MIGTRGYVSPFGGTVWAAGDSTANVNLEAGVRVAPHLLVFGNIGHFRDLQTDLTSSLNAQTSALQNDGTDVQGVGTLPASFVLGGLSARRRRSEPRPSGPRRGSRRR